MNAERLRAYLLTLPHVAETVQWGGRLVFWVGAKSAGGKMFAILSLDLPRDGRLVSFAAGPERFHELLERDGFVPAPYLARAHWIAATTWTAFRSSEWEEHLCLAHDLTLAKLPARVRAVLNVPGAL